VLCAGGVVTLIGTRVIDRVPRPRGCFVDVGGFPQHVTGMGEASTQDAPPIVVLHGAGSNLEEPTPEAARNFFSRWT